MIDRRRFLKGATAAAAGVAAGVVLTVNNPFEELPSASAAADERFQFRGRTVVITPHGNTSQIRVNARQFHAQREENRFHTHLQPFSEFPSARKAAEAVIEAEDAGLLII